MSSQCLCQFKPSQKRLTHLKYDWSVRWSSHQCYSLVMVTKLTADCSHCRYSDWRIETSQSSVTVRSRNTKLNFTLSIKHQIYWSDNNVTLRNIHFIKVLHFSSLGPTLSDDSLKQSYVTEAPASLHVCMSACLHVCMHVCRSSGLQAYMIPHLSCLVLGVVRATNCPHHNLRLGFPSTALLWCIEYLC